MQTSTRDPLPEPPLRLEDLPDQIHGEILKHLKEKTWASAVKNLVERERIKIENEQTPITVNYPIIRRSIFGGYYTEYRPGTFQDLEHIRERREALNMLTPMELIQEGFTTEESIRAARRTFREAETQIYYRGFRRTRDVQRQLERDVKTSNYLEQLIKKSY